MSISYPVKFFSIFILVCSLVGASIPIQVGAQYVEDPWNELVCDRFFTDNFWINFVNILSYSNAYRRCLELYAAETTIPDSGTINRPVSSNNEPGSSGLQIAELQEGVVIGAGYLLAQQPEISQTKRAQEVFGKIKKLSELPASHQEFKDHIYGPATQESVRMLQVLMGLPVKHQTGVMGPITANRLQKIFMEIKQQRMKKQSSSSGGSSITVSPENELAVKVEIAQIIQSIERILSLVKR